MWEERVHIYGTPGIHNNFPTILPFPSYPLTNRNKTKNNKLKLKF